MTKIQVLFLALILVSISTLSCHKHHNDDDDNAPEITITAPTIDVSISGAVTISGLVTDESMHEVTIKVTKDIDNSTLFFVVQEAHNLTSYTIAEVWTPVGIVAETAVTLIITAEDHNEHLETKTLKFKVKP